MKNTHQGDDFRKADDAGYTGTSNPWGCSYFACLAVLVLFVLIGVSVAVADWLESRVPAKCACVSDAAAAGGTKPCPCCSLNQQPESGKKAAAASESTENTKKHDKSSGKESTNNTVGIIRSPLSRLLNSLGLFKPSRPRR